VRCLGKSLLSLMVSCRCADNCCIPLSDGCEVSDTGGKPDKEEGTLVFLFADRIQEYPGKDEIADNSGLVVQFFDFL